MLARRARKLRRIAGPAAALIACALLLALLHGLSRGLDYRGVIEALRETPRAWIWLLILFTAMSYAALVTRDQFALNYVGVKVATPTMLLASFCGSALGNAVGLRALTGDTVRDRVYGAVGVKPEHTARVMLFINVAFAIGLGAFIAGSLMLAGGAVARLLEISVAALRTIRAVALLAIIAVLLRRVRRRAPLAIGRVSIEMPSLAITLRQLIAGTVDLAAAAAALWFLLPHGTIGFFALTAIFSAAIALGVVSRIPAGLGVFDIIVFVGLRGMTSSNRVAAALLIYRGVYFLLPLMLAAASLAWFELRSAPGRGSVAERRVSLGAALLAPVFLSAITFVVGAMLIVSGATPALDWRLAAVQSVLPLWAVEISHLLATLAGVFLLYVARGLYHRIDGAWWLALIIAVVNVGFCLAKGLAFAETAAMIFLVCLLLATRRQFTRPAAFLHQPFRLGSSRSRS